MNGSVQAVAKDMGVSLGHPEVIRVLEQFLAEAKAGRLASVAVIGVQGPGGVMSAAAGGGVMELNMGCDMMKAALLKNVSAKPSPILRPGHG